MAGEIFSASLNVEAHLDERQLQTTADRAAALIQKSFDKVKISAANALQVSSFESVGKRAQSSFVAGFTSGLGATIEKAIKAATTGTSGFESAGKRAGQDFSKGFSAGLKGLNSDLVAAQKSANNLFSSTTFASAEKSTAQIADNLAKASKEAASIQTAGIASSAAPVAASAAAPVVAGAGAGVLAADATGIEEVAAAQTTLASTSNRASEALLRAVNANKLFEIANQNLLDSGIVPTAQGLNDEIKQMIRFGDIVGKTANSTKKFTEAQVEAAAASKNFNAGLEKNAAAATKANSSTGSLLKTALSLGGGIGVGAFLTKGIGDVADVERQNKALSALQGQLGETADKSRKDIQRFADVSDFSFDQVFNNVIKLSNALKTNLPNSLAILNDIASAGFKVGASADQIDRFSDALIRTAAKGKISERELIEFADTGLASVTDIQNQIAKDTGKTIAQVQKEQQNSALSSAVAIKAVDEVLKTNAGNVDIASGNFTTLTGAISAFFDQIKQATAAGLEPFGKILRDSGPIVDQITQFIKTGLGPAIVALAKPLLDTIKGFTGTKDFAEGFKTTATALVPLVKNLSESFLKLLPSISNVGAVLTKTVFPALNLVAGIINKLSGPLGFLLQLFLEFKTISFIGGIFEKVFGTVVGSVNKIGSTLGIFGKASAASAAQAKAAFAQVTNATELAEAAQKQLGLQIENVGNVQNNVSLETTRGLTAITAKTNILSEAMLRLQGIMKGVAVAEAEIGTAAVAATPEVEGLAVAEGEAGAAGALGTAGAAAKTGLGAKILGKLPFIKTPGTVAEGAAAGEAAGGLAAAGEAAAGADAAATGLLGTIAGLSSAIPGIGIASVIAFTAISNASASANRHGQELLTTLKNINGVPFDVKTASINDIDNIIAKEKELAKVQDQQANSNHLRNVADLVNPFGKNIGANAAGARDAALKDLKDLQRVKEQEQSIFAAVSIRTGEQPADILKRANEAGIDLTTTNIDLAGTVDTLAKAYGNAGAAAKSSFQIAADAETAADTAAKKAEDNLNSLVAASDALKSAREAEVAAQDKVKDKVKEINDILGKTLTADQINKLTQSQIADLLSTQLDRRKELFDAADKLRSIDRDLADIAKQRTDAITAEHDRQASLQSDLLDFANKVKLADIGRTEALLAQVAAQKELDKLSKPQFVIDFNATTIAGTKTQLANAREVLKAQQFSKDLEDKKTEAIQAGLNLQKANIGIDTAQRDFEQANKDQAKFILNNSTAQADFNQLIDDLAHKEAGLKIDRDIAAKDQQNILTGQTGLIHDVSVKQKELLGLQKESAVAVEAAQKAQLLLAKAVADASGNQDKINKANTDLFNFLGDHLIPKEGDLNQQFKDQLKTLQDQTAERKKQADIINTITPAEKADALAAANRIKNNLEVSVANNIPGVFGAQGRLLTADQANGLRPFLQSLLEAATDTSGNPLGLQARDPSQNAAFINSLVQAILTTPGNDITDILKLVAKKLNIRLPGFAKGGLIEGVPGAFGQLIRAGEFGRTEAILPLQNATAMRNLLNDSRILDPIMAALPRTTLPSPAATSLDPAISLQRASAPANQSVLDAAAAAKERKLLAEDVGAAVAKALMEHSSDGGPVTVNINLDSTGYTQLDAKNIGRELERKFLSR